MFGLEVLFLVSFAYTMVIGSTVVIANDIPRNSHHLQRVYK